MPRLWVHATVVFSFLSACDGEAQANTNSRLAGEKSHVCCWVMPWMICPLTKSAGLILSFVRWRIWHTWCMQKNKRPVWLFSWFHRYAAAVACNFHTSWVYLLFDCWKLLWHGWSNTSDFRPTVDAMSWSENTCPSLWQSIRWFALLFPLGILPPWQPGPRPALLMCLDSGNAWRKWRERIQCWRVNCRMLRFVSLWWLIKGWTGTDSRDVIYCDFYLSQNTCV